MAQTAPVTSYSGMANLDTKKSKKARMSPLAYAHHEAHAKGLKGFKERQTAKPQPKHTPTMKKK